MLLAVWFTFGEGPAVNGENVLGLFLLTSAIHEWRFLGASHAGRVPDPLEVRTHVASPFSLGPL